MIFGDFRSVFYPYCLQKQKDGRYAVLNRKYKPIGFTTSEWVNYEDYPVLVTLKGLGQPTAALLSDNGDVETIYLYDDATNPVLSKENMQAYFDKLEILARLSVR
jgi:hypothetical protein